jgi:hypothetical protein
MGLLSGLPGGMLVPKQQRPVYQPWQKAPPKHLVEDATVVRPAGPLKVGQFKGFGTEYKGKDKDGEDAFWQVMIFAPKKDDEYYLMTVVCSDKDDKKTAADRDAIVSSVKAPSDDE